MQFTQGWASESPKATGVRREHVSASNSRVRDHGRQSEPTTNRLSLVHRPERRRVVWSPEATERGPTTFPRTRGRYPVDHRVPLTELRTAERLPPRTHASRESGVRGPARYVVRRGAVVCRGRAVDRRGSNGRTAPESAAPGHARAVRCTLVGHGRPRNVRGGELQPGGLRVHHVRAEETESGPLAPTGRRFWGDPSRTTWAPSTPRAVSVTLRRSALSGRTVAGRHTDDENRAERQLQASRVGRPGDSGPGNLTGTPDPINRMPRYQTDRGGPQIAPGLVLEDSRVEVREADPGHRRRRRRSRATPIPGLGVACGNGGPQV